MENAFGIMYVMYVMFGIMFGIMYVSNVNSTLRIMRITLTEYNLRFRSAGDRP